MQDLQSSNLTVKPSMSRSQPPFRSSCLVCIRTFSINRGNGLHLKLLISSTSPSHAQIFTTGSKSVDFSEKEETNWIKGSGGLRDGGWYGTLANKTTKLPSWSLWQWQSIGHREWTYIFWENNHSSGQKSTQHLILDGLSSEMKDLLPFKVASHQETIILVFPSPVLRLRVVPPSTGPSGETTSMKFIATYNIYSCNVA